MSADGTLTVGNDTLVVYGGTLTSIGVKGVKLKIYTG
jgi:hypothetical protein